MLWPNLEKFNYLSNDFKITKFQWANDRKMTKRSAITAVARDVHALQAVVRPPESSVINNVPLASIHKRQPQLKPQSNASTKSVNNVADQSAQSVSESAERSVCVPVMVGNSNASSSVCNNNTESSIGPTLPPNSTWASMASMVSTPVIHDNRFGVLTTTDDDDDGGAFVEPRSSRAARNN